uniref:PSME3-interacting protein-like isoform X2 n=1 Tax=Myxine glutinosa TaxID=7769 RepID=UPI00358EE889
MSGQLEIRQRFVTEGELEEKRRKRQEEWEKVRKPEDPLEKPEDVCDPRSLFEKLQEQKERKQAEFEEPLKFKNQVRGLEEDEAGFLSGVEAQRCAQERTGRGPDRTLYFTVHGRTSLGDPVSTHPDADSCRCCQKKEVRRCRRSVLMEYCLWLIFGIFVEE